jgi:KipI family sensor histidine kinase inhibitor
VTRSARARPAGDVTVRPFGDAAVLAEVGDVDGALVLARRVDAELRPGSWPGLRDVVVGFGTVTVTVDPTGADLAALVDVVSRLAVGIGGGPGADDVPPDAAGPVLEIAVRFDGPDLDEVARQAGMSVAGVVDLVAGAELRVAFVGFAPGFGYLVGLPPPLAAVPRRARPRPAVPAGSVAVGGGFAGVYPQDTPGGWHLVGRTGDVLFDESAPPYAVLAPGRRVRLCPSGAEPSPLPARRRGPLTSAAPALEVLEPGTCSLVEDAGRRAVAAIGVPRAGTADELSRRLANLLVGNPDDEAVLEITGRGPRLRAHRDMHAVVLGDPWSDHGVPVSVDGKAVPAAQVVPLHDGQVLEAGALGGAVRATLAVSGGLQVPSVLGSRSSDLLCGLGPGPLREGDVVGVGRAGRPRGALRMPRSDTAPAVLRVLPGPDAEAGPGLGVPAERIRVPLAGEWRVDRDSNRVGIRLVPDDAGEKEPDPSLPAGGGLPSRGMVGGAVQLPPGGEAIVLGPDHATVGGYRVGAVVIAADLHRLAHLAPGALVRFELVDRAEAAAAWLRLLEVPRRAVEGWFPTQAG